MLSENYKLIDSKNQERIYTSVFLIVKRASNAEIDLLDSPIF